ncbi:hypothetical protein Fmac_021098 [Flemingia macrophylla]|uniref:Uncharacterized protein n=1 Tax=Flemingia macrophylla TaxID=520843 RepID=A0ABD1LVW7_9FABA
MFLWLLQQWACMMSLLSLKIPDFWHLIALCASTSGSILIIGSAAGVAFMGMEKVEFVWYLRKVSCFALAGYAAGIAAKLVLRNLNISQPTPAEEFDFATGFATGQLTVAILISRQLLRWLRMFKLVEGHYSSRRILQIGFIYGRIKGSLGDGNSVQFWLDPWTGPNALAEDFPSIGEWIDGRWIWKMSWRRGWFCWE